MRITAITSPSFGALEMLRREAPDATLTVADNADDLRGHISGSDVILLAPRYGSILTDLWMEVRGVPWIHSLGAGVETLPFDLLKTTSTVVTNSRGLYADALAEFVLAAMLWFARDLRRLSKNQEAARWEPFTVERLEGKVVGIIGYGGIGQAVGRRAEALGMRVLPVRRRGELGDPTVDEVLAESDYVVLSTPLTPSTFRLLNRERLGRMRQDAVLINVSRGAIVDEQALLDMLRNGSIRGAALDVFETEPLPPGHPLWKLENVLISPHSADHTTDSHQRAMAFFLENLRRFRQGESLENVVDKEERY
ncbi:MAG TPA: D-2-hydroxyacid dehydrogenase [Thermoanaerobaculia bacterium]|nr:D-2-hydroxyacid dehydrogenase [Thermoanaerobaculia bacterium]